jgi:hypothetical protein
MVKRKIVWTQKANIGLFKILDFYAERNKSTTYSTKLYKRFTKELNLLIKQPEIGIKTDFESIRGLIVEEFILFYEVTIDLIIVHSVWDCRQNPADMKIV